MNPLEKICRTGIPNYDPWADPGDCVFDVKKAQLACDFFPEHLTHVKGKEWARKPFILERWQKAVIGNLFGWLKPNGMRRFTELFLYLPRKNGKSILAAGILCYIFFCDGAIGAEIVCAANKQDQAKVVWGMAYQMIRQSPTLSGMVRLYKNSIVDEGRAASFHPVSSESKNLDGPGFDAACIDEIHQAPNSGVIDVIETSQGAIDNPLLLLTTTAAEEGESVCNDKHEYASAVCENPSNDVSYLPVIYELKKGEDWEDPKNWARVNPNLGVSINIGWFRRQFEKAKKSPAFENVFKRLHLDMQTEQDARWLSMDLWDKCGDGVADPSRWRYEMLGLIKEKKIATAAGLDLGTIGDLTAFCIVFEYEDRTVLIPFFWMPEGGVADKDYRHKQLYKAWIAQGFITQTSGNIVDYKQAAREVEEMKKETCLVEIGMDPMHQAASMYNELTQEGYAISTIAQTYKGLSTATREFGERVMTGNISHGNNPVLRWMASNTALQEDASEKAMRPAKPKHKKNLKIDGIVAAIMGLGTYMTMEDPTSIYETRGIRSF